MPNVNPDILKWARETAGSRLRTRRKSSTSAKRACDPVASPCRLRARRARAIAPFAATHGEAILAGRSSRSICRRTPKIGERGQDFRTPPPEHSRAGDALVDALIRDVRARQEMVRTILGDEDEAVRLPFVGSMTLGDGAETAPAINPEHPRRRSGSLSGPTGQASGPRGFAFSREQAERVRIYVLLIGNLGSHHTSLDVETYRGFALADKFARFVVINDQDAETAFGRSRSSTNSGTFGGATGVSGANSGTGQSNNSATTWQVEFFSRRTTWTTRRIWREAGKLRPSLQRGSTILPRCGKSADPWSPISFIAKA